MFCSTSRWICYAHKSQVRRFVGSYLPPPRFNRKNIMESESKNEDKVKSKPKTASKGSLKRLLSLLVPEKSSCLAAVGLLGASTAVTLSVPLCVQQTVDAIFKTSGSELLNELEFEQVCLGFAGLFAVGAVANAGRIWFIQSASARVVKNLRADVYAAMLRNDASFFDENTSGELVNRLSADCQLVGDVLTQNVSDVLRSFGQSAVSIGLMVYVAPDLALRVAAIVPSIMIVAYFAGKCVRNLSKNLQNNLAEAASRAEEGLSNIKIVKAFGAEAEEAKYYSVRLNSILNLGYKSAALNSVYWSFLGGSGNFALLIVLYTGYQLSNSGSITPGTLTAFLLYTIYSGIGVAGLGKAYGAVMAGAGAGERLFSLIDTAPAPDNRAIIPVHHFCSDITFSDVIFRYPFRPDDPVLKGFTQTLSRGQVTALVGSSGCGKSTISWLLSGLYSCENGSIRIGDVDIKDIPSSQISQHIAIVPQEPPLFSASIFDNIAYGMTDYSEEVIILAADLADVTSFTSTLEGGIRAHVGNKGSSLSGGQKQRIAIARAIARKPDILILDEATSALDTVTETRVLDNIESHIHCTTIVIAHRLSTIKKADKIIVMDAGLVKEVGNFDSLIASGGMFSELVKLQEKSGS